MKRIALEEGGLEGLRAVVAGLAPGEPFHLQTNCTPATLNLALELGPAELAWMHLGDESVSQVRLPPGLLSLRLELPRHSEFDFATAALGQCPKLQELILMVNQTGNVPAFFAALERSTVTWLRFKPIPETMAIAGAYLQKDLLEGLVLYLQLDHDPIPILEALRGCTRLSTLDLWSCNFQGQALAGLPRSVTKLSLPYARFTPDFDWSFLARSEVTDFELSGLENVVDVAALGQALTTRLERGPLEQLRMPANHVRPTMRLDLIKRLELSNNASAETIKVLAATLVLPDSQLRELLIQPDLVHVQTYLVPALNHPWCRLTKLTLCPIWGEFKEIQNRFHQRLRLLALLQGQQVKKDPKNPLRRLPVELLRLVGMRLV